MIWLLMSRIESVAWHDDIAAARLARFRRHGSILADELRTGVDRDVAGIARPVLLAEMVDPVPRVIDSCAAMTTLPPFCRDRAALHYEAPGGEINVAP